jgi:hypothetical protein
LQNIWKDVYFCEFVKNKYKNKNHLSFLCFLREGRAHERCVCFVVE